MLIPEFNRDLDNAERMLRWVAFLSVVGSLAALYLWGIVWFAVALAIAAFAWFTGSALGERRPWARNAAFALGIIYLPSFPIGTLIGGALLFYLVKASNAGVFKQQAPETRA